MHIAICDDEQKELLHLQALAGEFDPGCDVSLFTSAEELLSGAAKQRYDVILLDIEMGGITGFDAASMLVKTQNPPLIVFVTNSREYAIQGYGVAFRYLTKPVSYTKLSSVLTAAAAETTQQSITITADGNAFVVPINDILYAEVSGHRLTVHTKQSAYECRMKLSDIEALLPRNTFASPHKGYLVNLDLVDMVGNDTLKLTSGKKIPLSRRRKQEFEQALFRFVRRQF